MSKIATPPTSDLERPPWIERKFAFVHPPWMLPDFVERLRGLVSRLGPLLAGVDDAAAYRQLDGSWSIAQNAGHLADVEELWQERLDDLRMGREKYTPADPARFQRLASRHQGRSLAETLRELGERRSLLVEAMESAPPALQRATAFHERLKTPMRLVDCAQFYAEHDDHHLLRIRALRSAFGLGRSTTPEVTTPFACQLSALTEEQRGRRAELAGRLRSRVAAVVELPDGYAFHLESEPGLAAEMRELITLEQCCCPFLRFGTSTDTVTGRLIVAITGDPGVKPFVAAQFPAPGIPGAG